MRPIRERRAERDLLPGDRVEGICSHSRHECFGKPFRGIYGFPVGADDRALVFHEDNRARGHIVRRPRLVDEETAA
jgi:hypothetical protein